MTKQILRKMKRVEKECRELGIILARLKEHDKLAGKLIDTAGHLQCVHRMEEGTP
jgi:hypothetical protein